MPRRSKGPYLYAHTKINRWVIRDGRKMRSTGCALEDSTGAQKALARYIEGKYSPELSSRPSECSIADVLMIYARDVQDRLARPQDLGYHITALEPYWGDRAVSDIRGETCRAYAKRRSTPSSARRELETLRAAVNHFNKEHGLDAVPVFTLPPKPIGRDRWLTRQEAAKLLHGALRTNNRHLARMILIGLYTGTRTGAILSLQWHPNTTGGWIDLENGVMYRRGQGQRETNKRRPPIRLPKKLLAHMKRWSRNDKTLLYLVHWNGKKVGKLRRSWNTARDHAGLDKSVVPHCLRHTCATWLMQAGVKRFEAAGFLGMTEQTLERVYGHHSPEFQKEAAEAL